MDVKITLSFDQDVIARAKNYAAANNISLSRLVEFILRNMTAKNYKSLEDLPVADWVSMVAEGPAEYQITPKSKKQLKSEYFKSKK